MLLFIPIIQPQGRRLGRKGWAAGQRTQQAYGEPGERWVDKIVSPFPPESAEIGFDLFSLLVTVRTSSKKGHSALWAGNTFMSTTNTSAM